jgi:hypothetical protein
MSNATELLRRALDELIAQDETICAEFCSMQPWRSPPIIKDIYDYLAAEQEAEPVGLIHSDGTFELLDDEGINFSEPVLLYLRPEPKRKPLTSNERLQGFIELRDNDDGAHLLSFLAGICFAEKHHGIIPRCENS